MPNCPSQQQERIKLCVVNGENIKSLRRCNQVIFPVVYNDKFYKDVLASNELARVVTYDGLVVGGVCCRIDNSNNQKRVYIMTLGCLPSYRRLGIGALLLEHVLNYAQENGLDSLYLHVQINNENALAFYKKFGFEIIDTKENYYKRIEPSAAHVLQKEMKKS
ncbi:N-alpha-acetyltransferase 50-like [Tetranychus urticae]|uniref:N-terminal methionine N(alpha)-acetyltransferase NatE n=1 Tax=Tetranychus urticae TaxID=32264 RepID=T1KDJ8_TETUR|nr:N-alpha-acetyltransferase 50-like [Tetranychus urticae]